MKKLKKIYCSLFLAVLLLPVSGQQYTSDSKRAVSQLKEAMSSFDARNYETAIEKAQKAIRIDDQFIEAYLFLAVTYIENNQLEKGVEAYQEGLSVDPDFFPNAYYDLAKNEFKLERYKDARDHLEKFLDMEGTSTSLIGKAKKLLKNAEFAVKAVKNPKPYELENLGDSINSEYDEYHPSLSADEKTLVITRNVPNQNINIQLSRQEDFYISEKKDGVWTQAEKMSGALNTPINEGAQALTVDGKTMYFTACDRPDGYGMCDLYVSHLEDGKWYPPRNLKNPVNTHQSEKQPTISADGKTLYFTSDRKGTHGDYDLWVTEKNNNHWTKPVNLGPQINTPGREMYPYLHPDGVTLYFASDGLIGMGGFDLFVVRKQKDGKWGEPENLGYPINTSDDEEGLIVNAAGNKGYISRKQKEGRGLDIFRFDLYPEARPVPVSYMKGTVYNANTEKPLNAKFELINIQTNQIALKAESDAEDGEFFITLPAGNDYALNVDKKGYLFFSEHFSLKDRHTYVEPYHMDIPLKPIKIGETIVLNNVFFETDKYNLKEKSKTELNKVVRFLLDNPNLSVEIGGHTDSIASEEYNQELSEKRARSVVQYLVDNGVDTERLSYKGYGELQPVADNSTAEGRAKNRRTELKVTGLSE